MSKQKMKYNAEEVFITRAIAGMLLFGLILASIWAVRKLHLMTGVAIFISTPLLVIGTVIVGVLLRRGRENGVDYAHRVWGMDYWFYILLTGAIAHGMLLVSLPVDWWAYTAPMAYACTLGMYLLYISAWNQGKNFRFLGILCLVVELGAMLNYQTYCNPKQNIIPFRLLVRQEAHVVGWLILALAALEIWRLGKKYKFSIWKQQSVLGICALFWLVMQQEWGSGLVVTWIFVGVVTIWYIVLRILRQIKVIL